MFMQLRLAPNIHHVLDDAGLQLRAYRYASAKPRTVFRVYWAKDISAHLLFAAMLGRLTLSGPISTAPSPSTP